MPGHPENTGGSAIDADGADLSVILPVPPKDKGDVSFTESGLHRIADNLDCEKRILNITVADQ